MSLYDRMLNISNVPKTSIIEQAIAKTKEELNGLDYERMCLVYTSYLYENLKNLSSLAYIVDTTDLGFTYKHQFILVPDIDKKYLLDLTYKQFCSKDKYLEELLNKGYQVIDDDLYKYYLRKVTNTDTNITIDESIFKKDRNKAK